MIPVRRRDAKRHAQIGNAIVRIMAAMHLADRLRVDVAGFGADKDALLEMGFEDTLQGEEERGAVVTMEVGPTLGPISAV